MATIKDVAAAAGVKPATVSYVLNGTGSVGATTRARVLDAVATLNYQPSHAARSLQRRQTRTLGLIVPTDRDPATWGLVVSGLVDAATLHGYDVLLSSATADHREDAILDDLVKSRRVDGVVFLDTAGENTGSAQIRDVGLPFVRVGRRGASQASVGIDNEAGMIEAVAHLVVQGCDRIALITPPLEWSLADEQDTGYRTALDEAGLPFDAAFLVEGGRSEAEGYDAALELLARPDPPDAIIAGLATLTFGVLHAAHELGLSVGGDVAVLACEEPRAAAHMAPPLTALRQPYYALGEQLAHVLVRRIAGEQPPPVVLYPQLIVRRSCGE